MQKFLLDNPRKIILKKKRLEKELNVKITNRGKEFYIKGNGEDEYEAEKVLKAIDFGFSYSHALNIKKKNCIFEKINIKDYSKTKNFERTRGRIIGKQGSVLNKLSEITDCFFEIKDNEVGIIGRPEAIQNAQRAIIYLAKGTKHSNAYKFLEKNKVNYKEPLDLGLKDSFKK